jgi:uncharacterized protein
MAEAHHPSVGHFVWYTLTTGDPAGSLAFYRSLFDWTAREVKAGPTGPWTLLRAGEHDLGGIVVAKPGPAAASYWLSHVGTDDVDAAVAAVVQSGGRVLAPAAEIPGIGRFAIAADPTGATFCPTSGRTGPHADAAMPGHFCWNELLTADPAAAAAFYRSVVGWAAAERVIGDGERYWIFRRSEGDVAGMMRTPPPIGGTSLWLPYIQVVSAEETAALASDLGGTIVIAPGDVPGRGRYAVVRDPGGALVAVYALTIAA